jgi:hypothetical protein
MNSPKTFRIVVAILLVTTIFCFVFLAKVYWQIHGIGGWQDQTFMYSGSDGARQALDDFQSGIARLYELKGAERDQYNLKNQFTGRRDDSLEVWHKEYYPSVGIANQYAESNWVAFYNSKMKYMSAHPEKFRRSTNNAANILAIPTAH